MKARYIVPILFFTNFLTYSFSHISHREPEVVVETKVVKTEVPRFCKHIVEEVVVMKVGSNCEKKAAPIQKPKITEHDLREDIVYNLKDPEYNDRLIEEMKSVDFNIPNGKVIRHTKTLDKTCKKGECSQEYLYIKGTGGDMLTKTIDKGVLQRAHMVRDGVTRSVDYNIKTGKMTALEINLPNQERHWMYFHPNGKVSMRYDEFDEYKVRHTFGEDGSLQKSEVTKIADNNVIYSNIVF